MTMVIFFNIFFLLILAELNSASVITHLSYSDEPASTGPTAASGPEPLQAIVDDDLDKEILLSTAPGIEYSGEDHTVRN